MRNPRSAGWVILRAAVAVAVLYALALQTILGGVLAADFAGPAHRLCLQADGQGVDGSGQPVAPHLHLPCCTAAHLPHPAPAPDTPVTVIAWPSRRVADVAWRAEVAAAPRAPPLRRLTARGPPTA